MRASTTARLIAQIIVLLEHEKVLQPFSETYGFPFYASAVETLNPILPTLLKLSTIRRVAWACERLILPGMNYHYLHRKFVIRQKVLKAIEDFGAQQVIMLAAGYDPLCIMLSKAYPKIDFIEIDQAHTQAMKLKAVKQYDCDALQRANLSFQSGDLFQTPLVDILQSSRLWDKHKPTVVVCEALTMYANEKQIQHFFQSLSAPLPQESKLLFTFMRKENGSIHFNPSSFIVPCWLWLQGEPFRWGIEPHKMTNFLSSHEFTLEGLFSPAQLREQFMEHSGILTPSPPQGEWLCVARKLC